MKTEQAVKSLLKMQKNLESAFKQCHELSAVMKQEHRAISVHNLNEVEALVSQKESSADALQTVVQDLLADLLALGEDALPERFELSLGLKIFEHIEAALFDDDLQSKTARYLLRECRKDLEQVLEVADRLRFDIHQNMVVLERMMDHHQESYRFWQTIAAEEGSQYGDRGEKQSSGHCSQLVVKV
ncbi:MAG: hypothetical protein AB8C84_12300 [Oligoflexales bacterium]